MKTILTPMTEMRLTVVTNQNGIITKNSKRVSKADKAADFYTLLKHHEWWSNIGCNDITKTRYDKSADYHRRLYRRSLKVFQRYLP